MPISCSCATELVSITNDPCARSPYGNQIIKIFLQKMTGAKFNGTALNSITEEADWNLKIAAVNDDKIIIIPNLAGAVKDSVQPNIEENNDVPYGVADPIDYPHSIVFDTKYINASTFADLESYLCGTKLRMYYLDSAGYLFGGEVATPEVTPGTSGDGTGGEGVTNVSFIPSSYGVGGIGTKNKFAGNVLRWTNLQMERPVRDVAGDFSFLETIS